jgi:hypothetical protein
MVTWVQGSRMVNPGKQIAVGRWEDATKMKGGVDFSRRFRESLAVCH